MIPLVVIRPEPGCAATVRLARERGLDARAHPLFAVAPRAWLAPDPATFDALLLGSANALRHAGPALAGWRGRRAYAVGATTAALTRRSGLEVVAIGRGGSGGLQDVLARLDPADRRLLRLAGEARVPLEPPPGVMIDERVVYASMPLAMPPALAGILRAPAVVALHSAEAARHFAHQADVHGLDRAGLALAALSPRAAWAAGGGWRIVAAAANPDDAALLAVADNLCHNRERTGQDIAEG